MRRRYSGRFIFGALIVIVNILGFCVFAILSSMGNNSTMKWKAYAPTLTPQVEEALASINSLPPNSLPSGTSAPGSGRPYVVIFVQGYTGTGTNPVSELPKYPERFPGGPLNPAKFVHPQPESPQEGEAPDFEVLSGCNFCSPPLGPGARTLIVVTGHIIDRAEYEISQKVDGKVQGSTSMPCIRYGYSLWAVDTATQRVTASAHWDDGPFLKDKCPDNLDDPHEWAENVTAQ